VSVFPGDSPRVTPPVIPPSGSLLTVSTVTSATTERNDGTHELPSQIFIQGAIIDSLHVHKHFINMIKVCSLCCHECVSEYSQTYRLD
jgi:hypothetical protein